MQQSINIYQTTIPYPPPARGIRKNKRNSSRLTFHLLFQLCSRPRYPESQKASGQSKRDRSHHQRTDSFPLLSLYLSVPSYPSLFLSSSDTSCVPRLSSSSLSSLCQSGSLSLLRSLLFSTSLVWSAPSFTLAQCSVSAGVGSPLSRLKTAAWMMSPLTMRFLAWIVGAKGSPR